MARMPGAIWKPLAADWASQPRMRAYDFFCLHTMVGGLDGTDGYFRNKNGIGYGGTESHFGVGPDGTIYQWQDTAFQADANGNGNWHVISSENADTGAPFPVWGGSDVPAFTPQQIEANARIAVWLYRTHGIPLDLTPDSKPGRRGLAVHRWGVPGYMVAGAEQWSTSRGKACPGDRRVAQTPQVSTRAKQLAAGVSAEPTTDEDDDMPRFDLIRNKDTGEMVLAAPGLWYHIPDANFVSLYVGRGLLKDGTPDIDVADHEFAHFRSIYLSAVIDTPIPRSDEAGGSFTSLRAQAQWEDHNFRRVTPQAVAELVTAPQVDVDALASKIAPLITGASKAEIAGALRTVLREGVGADDAA